jgi:hypothetical protein
MTVPLIYFYISVIFGIGMGGFGVSCVDGSVFGSMACLIVLFSEEFIRRTAVETGFIKRERRVDPVIMFWVVVLGFGVNFMRSVCALKRGCETVSGVNLSISSFCARFTPEVERFLHRCVVRALACQVGEPGWELGGKLKPFKDLIIRDCAIIRLHGLRGSGRRPVPGVLLRA